MSRLRFNLGFARSKDYYAFMKTVNNSLGFDSSDKAKLKLRCIEILDNYGYEAVALAFPHLSKATVYRWRKRYYQSGKKLLSLVPRSTKPKTTRQMQASAMVLGFIKLMRSQYPKLSKYKLKPFLDDYCQQNNLPIYSVSWIGKVIKRYNFFFNHGRLEAVKKRKQSQKQRIKTCPKDKQIKLGYLQIDGVTIYYHGVKLCYLNAIELKTRQAFCKRVSTISSLTTSNFIKEIISQVDYPIHTIQSDNGSEFEAVFRSTLTKLNINQLNSYPKRPKTQGYIERFNWTFEDEFLYYHLDTALEDLSLLDKKTKQWLHWYNHKRPHQSLSYQTPNQALQYQLQNLNKSLKCV